MLKELNNIACDQGVERLTIDLVEGQQDDAIKIAERLGFTREAVLYNRVPGVDGKRHNIVIMEFALDV
jgi:hypothetical protein